MVRSYTLRFLEIGVRVRDDLRIGEWLIQPQLHTISRNGQISRVEPKAMQVLLCLARRSDEVVTKERLINEVWAGTFVTDDVLTRCISELRRAFDDDPKDPRVIQTIPRSGYRLVAPVRDAASATVVPGRSTVRVPVAIAVALGVMLLAFVLNLGNLRGRLWSASSGAKIQSVVVLPLENLSHDPEQDYFADGMTEELITELTKIRSLHVISRRSATYYKGTKKKLPQIAQELGVDGVIEGTVQRSGDRVRVSAQLVEARTDHHLWAETYDRDLHDVLALEGQVAQAIAREIRLQLTPPEHAQLTEKSALNPEAHEAYLKGMYCWSKLTEEDVRKSITYFERAIRLAPDFAPAYASLAFSYNLLASDEYVAPRVGYPKAKKIARKALEVDPNLAYAHAALEFALYEFDWDWHAAEEEFRRANELEPNGDGAHHVYALYLVAMGTRSTERFGENVEAEICFSVPDCDGLCRARRQGVRISLAGKRDGATGLPDSSSEGRSLV
jgi:TolB-like protein/DNA-binding winged helix-turn-helix (wHTH) protein